MKLLKIIIIGFVLLIGCACLALSVPSDISQSDLEENMGHITGARCYPSEILPAMIVYAREIDTNQLISVDVDVAPVYTLTVPAPGQYIVFAWTGSDRPTADSLGGHYSCDAYSIGRNFVDHDSSVPEPYCEDWSDHTPLPVEVTAGATVKNIHICDWYEPDLVPRP